MRGAHEDFLHQDASPELSVRQALDALIKAGIYSAEGGGTINDRCQVQFTSYRCADGALFDSQEYASANGLPTRSIVVYFVGHNLKTDQRVGSERGSEGYIDRVTAPCHQYPPNPRHIIPRIKGIPAPA